MEDLIRSTFETKLQVVASKLQGVVLIETSYTSKADRERMCKIMMEMLEVQNYKVLDQSVMTLTACGSSTSGLLVYSSKYFTQVVPVY